MRSPHFCDWAWIVPYPPTDLRRRDPLVFVKAMKLLTLISALLVLPAQPLTAQRLGSFIKELETKSKDAEAHIVRHCELPANLKNLIDRKDTARLTKLANKWIDDCKRILKEKELYNKTTDYYLTMARSLIPTIRTLTQKDLDKYVEALEVLIQRSNQR